jgi:hypothetical protein
MIENDVNTGSTGGLDFAYRTNNRGYLNNPRGVMHDLTVLRQQARIGEGFIARGRRNVTRMVARNLVTEGLLQNALTTPELAWIVEAAVPTRVTTRANGRGSDRVWMMMSAINHPSRMPERPLTDLVSVVDAARRNPSQSPENRIATLRRLGYTFLTNIPKNRIGEVFTLWKEVFGWKEEGVIDLSQQLQPNPRLNRINRHMWFSAVIDPDTKAIQALATAERLDMPKGDGTFIPIVENTEWLRADGVGRNGLVAAAVSHVNAQVLHDIGELNPLIIAETNIPIGAYNVAFAAGMDMPCREIDGALVHQILKQNVAVVDGLQPVGLRDFSMMYLSPEKQGNYYNRKSRRSILKGAQ